MSIPFQSTKGFKGFLNIGDGLEKDGQGNLKVKLGDGLSFNNGKIKSDSMPLHSVLVVANDAKQWYKDKANYQCDGTDDESEIQSALDESDVVYLSDGTFNVKEVRMNSHNQLIGAGMKATTLKLKPNSNSSSDTFVLGNKEALYSSTFKNEANWDEDLTIANLSIEPDRTNQDLSASRNKASGLFFMSCRNIKINNIWANTGVGTQNRLPTRAGNMTCHHGVDNILCTNSIFSGYTGWTHNYVTLYDGVRHAHFYNCEFQTRNGDDQLAVDFVHGNSVFSICIQMADDQDQDRLSFDFKVIDCYFTNPENVAQFNNSIHGIMIHGEDTSPDNYPVGWGAHFSGNVFDRVGQGIKLLGNSSAVNITNNTFRELRQTGIYTTFASVGRVLLNVDGNNFINHRGNAPASYSDNDESLAEMYFIRGSVVNISNNISRVTDVGFDNTDSIPDQTEKSAFCTIIGCHRTQIIGNNLEDSQNNRHMIFIRDSTNSEDGFDRTSDNMIITNNLFAGNSSYNIVEYQDTVSNKVEANNLKQNV